jgi:hypothetical protein
MVKFPSKFKVAFPLFEPSHIDKAKRAHFVPNTTQPCSHSIVVQDG